MDKEEYKKLYENKKIEQEQYYSKIGRQHAENMRRWMSETPEQKTDRQWESVAKTKYLLRNEWKEPNPQRVEMIKARILAWFQEKNEAWCLFEVYEDLLPPSETKKVGGFQKIGELLSV